MKNLYTLFLVLLLSIPAMAQRQSEQLDRGLVAVKNNSGVYLGWRVLGQEWIDVSYNIYKNGTKINNSPIATSSNYVDKNGTISDHYAISPVISGVEQTASEEVSVNAHQYFDIPINRPQGGTVQGSTYTYSANDASTADLNGDGELDIILKWDPSNAHDNSQGGYTGEVIIDGYQMDGTRLWRINLGKNVRAGAHYTQFLVYDFDGDGKAEMICRTADGTTDGKGIVIGNANADYRNTWGYVLSGPEFLTVFDGMTGEALKTVDYEPARGSVSNWGDSYGNRVDRFGAVVAYLDGEHPSAVMARGYYERSMLAAYDWDGTTLSQRWLFNSEAGGLLAYSGQGNHSISVADVDNDGKDEIIYGQMTLDDNGTGLYSTGLGHGDALHVTDHDPDLPGLEVFTPHEEAGNGVSFRAAETGHIYWQHKRAGEDIGRGAAANILSTHRGSEVWASSGMGLYDVKGKYISSMPNSINFAIYWDADVQRELLNGISINKFSTNLITAVGMHSCNSTKSTPSLQADIIGDWREEAIWASNDESFLRLFTTTNVTTKRIYSLMHDSQYRVAIAWQNGGYNQPPHPSFLIENDLALPMPEVFSGIKWKGTTGNNVWHAQNNFYAQNGEAHTYADGDSVIFSMRGTYSEAIDLQQNVAPSLVVVSSPSDLSITGSGALTGSMNLFKTQKGSLTLTGDHSYSGKTVVTDGALIIDGTLENTDVSIIGGIWGGKNSTVNKGGRLGGSGTIAQSVTIRNRGALLPGMSDTDTLSIGGNLKIENYAVCYFDLTADPDGDNDIVAIAGDLNISTGVSFKINLKEGGLNTGKHVLFSYNGSFTGSTSSISMSGLDGIFYRIKNENGQVFIEIDDPREAKTLTWTGTESNIWALDGALNWTNQETGHYFLPNDSLLFTGSGSFKIINTVGLCETSEITFDAQSHFLIKGEGEISGSGGLIKKNTGTTTISTVNSFEGPTAIMGGKLSINNLAGGNANSALGRAGVTSDKLIVDGGILEITGSSSSSDKGMTIGESDATFAITKSATKQTITGIIKGEGALIKEGEGTLVLGTANSYSGGTIINGGTLELLNDAANENGLGSGPLTINKGTLMQFDNMNSSNTSEFNITIPANATANYILDSRSNNRDSISGAGELNLQINYTRTELQGNWSSFVGTINVSTDADGGEFKVSNPYGYAQAEINLNDKVKAYRSGNDTLKIGQLNGTSTSYLNNSKWVIGSKDAESNFEGTIVGGELIKVGTNKLILSGTNNTYPGGTRVKSGSLWLMNTSGNSTGTGQIIVEKGAVLGGTGITKSHINIKSGAFISPGNPIGAFTSKESIICEKNSLMYIDLNTTEGRYDQIVTNAISLQNSKLLMVNSTPESYAIGEEFKIIRANTIEGRFSGIYPENPGGNLFWNTSKLYSEGIIYVTDQAPSSIDEQWASSFSIYPNPAEDVLYIDQMHNNNIINSVKIYGMEGTLIKTYYTTSDDTIKLDVSNIPAGIYLIQISTDNMSIARKIRII
ncbi:MAG: autotransporter-associated beta strand repeat-containing protein [Bacteroidales bacterium]|jgi:fibronectin-binding autotransporter adhesin|nr:autotransporter-associated beta strand repeat-containing protein [Bacteroidales bacterium]